MSKFLPKLGHDFGPILDASVIEGIRFDRVTVAANLANARPVMAEGIDLSRTIR
jgi:hypothetical protein